MKKRAAENPTLNESRLNTNEKKTALTGVSRPTPGMFSPEKLHAWKNGGLSVGRDAGKTRCR